MNFIDPSDSGLPTEITEHYTFLGKLEDGRICGIHRLLFHWTLHIGIDHFGYEDRYCYSSQPVALLDMIHWEGEGDPPTHWHKHPATGRCRDPLTGEIWNESEVRKRG